MNNYWVWFSNNNTYEENYHLTSTSFLILFLTYSSPSYKKVNRLISWWIEIKSHFKGWRNFFAIKRVQQSNQTVKLFWRSYTLNRATIHFSRAGAKGNKSKFSRPTRSLWNSPFNLASKAKVISNARWDNKFIALLEATATSSYCGRVHRLQGIWLLTGTENNTIE